MSFVGSYNSDSHHRKPSSCRPTGFIHYQQVPSKMSTVPHTPSSLSMMSLDTCAQLSMDGNPWAQRKLGQDTTLFEDGRGKHVGNRVCAQMSTKQDPGRQEENQEGVRGPHSLLPDHRWEHHELHELYLL